MCASATPATRNEGKCRHVPRLPRETKVDVAKPAPQNEGGCRHVPRLPRETKVDVTQVPRLPRKTKVDVGMCHACHAKRRCMPNESGCRQVPRLPRKVPRRHGRLAAPKRATRASPVQQVLRLPRETKVDVAKRHACHAKRRWMSPSATPATQSAAASRATNGAQARHQSQPSATSATPATQNEGGCHQVPRLPRERKVDGV